MTINTKAKGNRAERKCRDWLATYGYKSTKAGASLGTWDLIAVNNKAVLLCQVKSNRWPRTAEMKAMEEFDAPWGAIKLVVRYDDGAQKPRLKRWIINSWVELSHKTIVDIEPDGYVIPVLYDPAQLLKNDEPV